MSLTSLVSLTLTMTAAFGGISLPQTLDMDGIRALPVQHDGRWPPLDTVARDLLDSVTGDEHFGGHDPVALLLGWTFDPESWRNAPLIPIKSKELRQELKLSSEESAFSFNQLIGHRPIHALVDELANLPEGQKLDPLQSKVTDIHNKLQTLQSIFMGRELKLIPDPDDPLAPWLVIPASTIGAGDGIAELSEAFSVMAAAFLADDASEFGKASATLTNLLGSHPAAHRPASALINTELRYNALQPFRTAWVVMLVGAALAACAIFLRRRWFDLLTTVAIAMGFVALTYGLMLRWQIAGRIPASNMFESLLFLSWGACLFATVTMPLIRNRTVPLTAAALGAIALMLADLLPVNHFIRPIAPVLLDTVWMSIHVPIIMVSYSVLAIGVVIAHAQLITMAVSPTNRRVSSTIDDMLCKYIEVGSWLLLVGIITGSMWAASSWGRYWGWDPKEVWSLVALLAYLTILHVRIDRARVPRWAYMIAAVAMLALFAIITPKLAPMTAGKVIGLGGAAAAIVLFVLAQGPFATAFKSILAFWMIIMTYVGVNYVLGVGLHSYGFGTGAMSKYMLSIGGVDLGLALLCSVVYLARRPRPPAGYTSAHFA